MYSNKSFCLPFGPSDVLSVLATALAAIILDYKNKTNIDSAISNAKNTTYFAHAQTQTNPGFEGSCFCNSLAKPVSI